MYINSKFTFLCYLEGSMQEWHMEGEMLNKVPLVQDRSALDKPASSSIPQRVVERGSAFSPYSLYATVFLEIHRAASCIPRTGHRFNQNLRNHQARAGKGKTNKQKKK